MGISLWFQPIDHGFGEQGKNQKRIATLLHNSMLNLRLKLGLIENGGEVAGVNGRVPLF